MVINQPQQQISCTKQLQQCTFIHTLIDCGTHTYMYKYIYAYACIYTRTQTTHVVRKFRAFCLRESVHDCRLRVYAPRAIGNGHQPDMHSPGPHYPNDFVESAQLLFFSSSFSHILAFFVLFTYFFQTFVLTVPLSLSLNCDSYFQCSTTHVFCWYESKRAHVSVCACSFRAKKNIGNPKHTHTNTFRFL